MIKLVSHKDIKYLTQALNKEVQPKITREIKEQHSLSKPMIYTFFSPLATSYQKVQKCIVLNDSQA